MFLRRCPNWGCRQGPRRAVRGARTSPPPTTLTDSHPHGTPHPQGKLGLFCRETPSLSSFKQLKYFQAATKQSKSGEHSQTFRSIKVSRSSSPQLGHSFRREEEITTMPNISDHAPKEIVRLYKVQGVNTDTLILLSSWRRLEVITGRGDHGPSEIHRHVRKYMASEIYGAETKTVAYPSHILGRRGVREGGGRVALVMREITDNDNTEPLLSASSAFPCKVLSDQEPVLLMKKELKGLNFSYPADNIGDRKGRSTISDIADKLAVLEIEKEDQLYPISLTKWTADKQRKTQLLYPADSIGDRKRGSTISDLADKMDRG
ncbi:hypothetical protein J6590_055363 [Homalodisca vitripennis]|nr:hypothetical protein J6590_055363 [Homalodisca vitripennis]